MPRGNASQSPSELPPDALPAQTTTCHCRNCHCVWRKCEKYVREDESVAVDPFGVLGVESHELVPHDVGHRSHAHGGTRMARVCLERGIDLSRKQRLAIDSLYTPAALLGRNHRGGVGGLCMAGQR
jgi:hypothetical protein